MAFKSPIQALLGLSYVVQASYDALALINYGHLKSTVPSIRDREEQRLLHVLETVGFFILTNHGMDHQIMDRAWNDSILFFDSSEENKFSVPISAEYIYGYSNEEVLSQSEDDTVDAYAVMDKKEIFGVWIGAEHTNRSRDVLWTPYPKRMESSWTAYYRASEKIMFGLLESIASILDLKPDFFAQYSNDHLDALRALNYPAIDDTEQKGGMRCSQHTDWGLLTLVRQDIVGGLQIENEENEWMDAISDFYDFVVNIGDLLQRWTNDRFKSTRHRVVDYYAFNGRNITERRQSMAYFGIPNGDTMVDAVDACLANEANSKYSAVNVWQYLTNKHSIAVDV